MPRSSTKPLTLEQFTAEVTRGLQLLYLINRNDTALDDTELARRHAEGATPLTVVEAWGDDVGLDDMRDPWLSSPEAAAEARRWSAQCR